METALQEYLKEIYLSFPFPMNFQNLHTACIQSLTVSGSLFHPSRSSSLVSQLSLESLLVPGSVLSTLHLILQDILRKGLLLTLFHRQRADSSQVKVPKNITKLGNIRVRIQKSGLSNSKSHTYILLYS